MIVLLTKEYISISVLCFQALIFTIVIIPVSPRENGGGQDAQKDLHSRAGRDEKKGKTQERMERGSRKRSSSAGSEKMERVGTR